jgi:nucleoid-associated protein YgaU
MPPATRDAVIACESGGHNIEHGGDPGGVSTASGVYQFVNGTWRYFGGTEFAPRAIAATRQQQDTVADRAYAANGLKDWEASRPCWSVKLARHSSGQEAPRHAVVTHHHHHHRHGTVGQIHVVQRGDTLSGIAAAHELDLGTILAANAEIIDNPNVIFPGQRIRI